MRSTECLERSDEPELFLFFVQFFIFFVVFVLFVITAQIWDYSVKSRAKINTIVQYLMVVEFSRSSRLVQIFYYI